MKSPATGQVMLACYSSLLVGVVKVLWDEFLRQCRDAAQQIWKYGDLVQDNPEDIERAYIS
jgi:hypothetical protein